MREGTYVAVGLGEVLWDLLSQGKQLGGAPANFAYISSLLGERGVVASAVGTDTLGDELRRKLNELKLDASSLQVDPRHPTGTVRVHLDEHGQPTYEITQNVAWDFLEWTSDWQRLASEADVISFGSLAQRLEVSRATIRAFLSASPPEAIRIFDVNLRQQFFSGEVLSESLRRTTVAKLNDGELPVAMRELGLDYKDEKQAAQRLRETFGLRLVCVTRGRRGSLLVSEKESDEHSGFEVRVADLVGAGDAFTAALAHHLLRGSPLRVANEAANRMGAWVASQSGATPPARDDLIREVREAD